eukprot:TRINITY_DN231_c0_g1_i1.p1 TRINITY_DN231_c0_g1~~TRINITY_DN231_c0_g1_i1.p1  ORF type:complete len:328 (-),score=66.17 TRINITY_DN231_c0_g1_i1:426-1409(-)
MGSSSPADWSVLVFGDSWAEYWHPTWALVVAQRLGAKAHQHAKSGSWVEALAGQADKCLGDAATPKEAGGKLKPETLVIVHSCGNDIIAQMKEALPALLGGGLMDALKDSELFKKDPGRPQAAKLVEFLETMYAAGARNFLVSTIPVFPELPLFKKISMGLRGVVKKGALQDLGISPDDPPSKIFEVQGAALTNLWGELCSEFEKAHPDCHCVVFDEVAALHKLRDMHGAERFDKEAWDGTMYHPTAWGHEEIAGLAHKRITEALPKVSHLNPHPDAVLLKAPAPEPIEIVVRNEKDDVHFTVNADTLEKSQTTCSWWMCGPPSAWC